ncbi:GIY-YIG nuclease family protein [Fusobacterium nucleatum]|nr:GIY-YIG nuclease family protein [Fusobacterium nucleatum]WDF24594.1 GIY-YIG nuclease family protein [Fusobacterium nucleatum]
MSKEFYFKSISHFENFLNKNGNFSNEEKEDLKKICDKAIKGDEMCKHILKNFTYHLKFNSETEKDFLKNVCLIAKEVDNKEFRNFAREKEIFKNDLKFSIEYYLENEKYTLSNEFVKSMEYLYYAQGLYFIYDKNKKLIYIGKSRNLGSRVVSSLKERKGYYFKYKLTKTMSDANILEIYYITTFKPILNTESNEDDCSTINIDYEFDEESDFIKMICDN